MKIFIVIIFFIAEAVTIPMVVNDYLWTVIMMWIVFMSMICLGVYFDKGENNDA